VTAGNEAAGFVSGIVGIGLGTEAREAEFACGIDGVLAGEDVAGADPLGGVGGAKGMEGGPGSLEMDGMDGHGGLTNCPILRFSDCLMGMRGVRGRKRLKLNLTGRFLLPGDGSGAVEGAAIQRLCRMAPLRGRAGAFML
jgi:hypothetical protein